MWELRNPGAEDVIPVFFDLGYYSAVKRMEKVQNVIEELKTGAFDELFPLGYGFMVRFKPDVAISVKREDGVYEVKPNISIVLPLGYAVRRVKSGVEVAPQESVVDYKVIEAIVQGMIAPNFYNWDYFLRPIQLKHRVSWLASSNLPEGYSHVILDERALVSWFAPIQFGSAFRVFFENARKFGVPPAASAEDLVNEAVRTVKRLFPELEQDTGLFVNASVMALFYQLAGAILSGLVEPAPFVITGYNERLLMDPVVQENIDYIFARNGFDFVDWENLPEKPVDEWGDDMWVTELDGAGAEYEMLRDDNLQWASAVGTARRLTLGQSLSTEGENKRE